MDPEDRTALLIISIAVILACLLAGYGMRLSDDTKRFAMAHGYEQRPVPGSTSLVWVKSEGDALR